MSARALLIVSMLAIAALVYSTTAVPHDGISGCTAVDQGPISVATDCSATLQSHSERYFANNNGLSAFAAGNILNPLGTGTCGGLTALSTSHCAMGAFGRASRVRFRCTKNDDNGVAWDAGDQIILCPCEYDFDTPASGIVHTGNCITLAAADADGTTKVATVLGQSTNTASYGMAVCSNGFTDTGTANTVDYSCELRWEEDGW